MVRERHYSNGGQLSLVTNPKEWSLNKTLFSIVCQARKEKEFQQNV